MKLSGIMKIFSIFVSFLLFVASVSSAPSSYSSEYDNSIRELVEMLMQRERENSLEESRLGYHTVARKAGRSPQLRLRFGKRMDSGYPVVPAYIPGINEGPSDN